ncbi:hypothetical protein V6C53_00040 [Desulfocurvibacter africanus]|uniref:hypothetical protein n=1 Tax=Desulfocurvibacter africanus TaxID=873 RepID=UPI00059CC229|nr:hypothetical protein [Desulfocurvibacter africanus]
MTYGVHDELSDTDLAEALAEDSPVQATGRLIALALEHGGRDNATAWSPRWLSPRQADRRLQQVLRLVYRGEAVLGT